MAWCGMRWHEWHGLAWFAMIWLILGAWYVMVVIIWLMRITLLVVWAAVDAIDVHGCVVDANSAVLFRFVLAVLACCACLLLTCTLRSRLGLNSSCSFSAIIHACELKYTA